MAKGSWFWVNQIIIRRINDLITLPSFASNRTFTETYRAVSKMLAVIPPTGVRAPALIYRVTGGSPVLINMGIRRVWDILYILYKYVVYDKLVISNK